MLGSIKAIKMSGLATTAALNIQNQSERERIVDLAGFLQSYRLVECIRYQSKSCEFMR